MQRGDDGSDLGPIGDETATRSRMGVDIGDGVDETADAGDHRNRAVPHRLHLGEPTGLEPARHNEKIGAGEHEVGQLLVIALDESESLRMGDRELPEAVGEIALP